MTSRDDRDTKPGKAARGPLDRDGLDRRGDAATNALPDDRAGMPAPSPDATPILDASTLLGVRGVVHIAHAGQVYTLRVTRNDRLILTK